MSQQITTPSHVELPTPVTCRSANDGKQHYSEIPADTPVLLDGGSVAYTTGWEERGCFEVRLGNSFGPVVLLATVTPSSRHMINRHRALMSAAYLNFALMAIADEADTEGSTDPADIEGLTHHRNAVSAVAGNVKRLTY